MIKTSRKPKCLIVDFVGNSGRHKLCSTADILGGADIDLEVIETVAKKARQFGKPLDMAAEMERAKLEIEARKRIEAAKRLGLQARAQYLTSKVDPFNVWDITPVKETAYDKRRRFTAKQAQVLLERIGVDPKKIPYGQGKQLLDEYFRRINNNMASLKQAALLRKKGFSMPLRHDAANRMISRMAETWRK